MSAPLDPPQPTRGNAWAFWAVTAAFGVYFCMYGFRKPFTAAEYQSTSVYGVGFKAILVASQTLGYMLSKFIGIKVISEMPANRRAVAILILIFAAEAALVMFGLLPRPFNASMLFFNGLALGMVFGLVLGFLEGRRVTEALAAGLCTSFILADGVTKTVGTWLLQDMRVPEDWMPAAAGLVYLAPLCFFVAMLARIPQPDDDDVVERSKRTTMNRHERWELFSRYRVGLLLLVMMYLLITIIRSIRADFAPELWRELGTATPPSLYTRSELLVALGVLAVNGFAAYFRNNRVAFFFSLAVSLAGFTLVAVALLGQQSDSMAAFPFMVLVGFGLYLPYVAMHTTVFERMLAMTRERGNLGFLMYVADAYGYLSYVLLVFSKPLWTVEGDHLSFFTWVSWVCIGLSTLAVLGAWRYFAASDPTLQPSTDAAK